MNDTTRKRRKKSKQFKAKIGCSEFITFWGIFFVLWFQEGRERQAGRYAEMNKHTHTGKYRRIHMLTQPCRDEQIEQTDSTHLVHGQGIYSDGERGRAEIPLPGDTQTDGMWSLSLCERSVSHTFLQTNIITFNTDNIVHSSIETILSYPLPFCLQTEFIFIIQIYLLSAGTAFRASFSICSIFSSVILLIGMILGCG